MWIDTSGYSDRKTRMDRAMDRHDRILRWKDADEYRVHRHERILR
jgi:hypothetical protein